MPVKILSTVETRCTTNPQQIEVMELEGYSWSICSKQPWQTSFVDNAIDLLWQNFPSPACWTKFQRKVPEFLEIPKFPYNSVGQVEGSLHAKPASNFHRPLVAKSNLWCDKYFIVGIGADSTGATGNFAPVLTQEPGQTLRSAPVPFMAVLLFLSERCSSTC